MRINAANCVLLACLAVALAAAETARSKRHLQQWKDAILSKFLGNTAPKEENIRFFRIPGHENILVKAVPKIDTIETAVVTPEKLDDSSSTIAILKSYLGTKSASETLSALQGVKQLLQSGVLSVRHEPSEIVPYEKSAFLVPPFISERIEFVQPRPAAVISGPPKIPLIPVLPPAAEAPQVIEEIIPMKAIPTTVPELVPYPELSCKQMKTDGSVVTHTVTDEILSDVVVTETNKPLPRPPSFIVDRLRKIFLQLPLGTQNFPVHPLPPLPSPVPLNPIPFDIYSKFEIPSIHTMINVPKGEVQVHTYPARKVHIDDKLGSFASSADTKVTDVKIIAEEPAPLMPPPPPFIVNRIENTAALSAAVPKADKLTGFQIVDKEDYIIEQKLLRNPGHLFYNSQPFAAPLTSEYVYRPPIPFKPDQYVNLVSEPAYVSKDDVIVKVNKGTKKPKDYYNQQSQQQQYESQFPSGGWREVRPNTLVTKPVEQMPVPPVHIIKRIENVAAKAHAVPKISRGYAFKINYPPFIDTNNEESTEQPTTYKVDTKFSKPSITKDKGAPYIAESMPFSYVYKQISHNNPKPFTLVQLEDKATYKPAGPVTITHEHARPDGSTYKCKEHHQVGAQFPEDYYYVPPVTAVAEVHLPTMHKVERLDDAEPQFSYVQVTNNGVYTNEDGTAAFNNDKHSNVLSSSVNVKVTSGKASSKNPEALSDNPIVVPETAYSFTQIHPNGSTTKVHNESGKGVTVDLSEGKKSSPRGDIPETFV